MSTKENTLQLLPPQSLSTSTSESEPETKITLIKIGKYIIYITIFKQTLWKLYYDSFFAFLSLKSWI